MQLVPDHSDDITDHKDVNGAEWQALEDEFDIVSIGYDEENRKYPVKAGFENWKQSLKQQFPLEHEAIDKFFDLMNEYGKKHFNFTITLKN